MSKQVTLGGERLRSGNKMKVELKAFERSTHNLSRAWRSTMAPGTLVPFLCELGLPGDTFDIDLMVKVLTQPTVGPLFGDYDIQLDIFKTAIRLYNPKLQLNQVNIGLAMQKVHLPQLELKANGKIDFTTPPDNQQINPSCILHYLGIKGLGHAEANGNNEITRKFNAVPLLTYWDIVKQYYSNKQEEIGAVIHKDVEGETPTVTEATYTDHTGSYIVGSVAAENVQFLADGSMTITGTSFANAQPSQFLLTQLPTGGIESNVPLTDIFNDFFIDDSSDTMYCSNIKPIWLFPTTRNLEAILVNSPNPNIPTEPTIETFPLSNIDDMRFAIMAVNSDINPYLITNTAVAPYGLIGKKGTGNNYSKQYSLEGLGLKTYHSDIFNNWLQTEFIEGPGSISDVTKIDTSGGSFTIDELAINKKIWLMLNRIAVTDGTYDAWINAAYDHERFVQDTTPVYIGGLVRNIVFDEVVSYSQSSTQPLGTLAGRGTMGDKHIGGQIIAKIDEPSYIMGIVSITPNIDYSQGNKWDMSLKTFDDFHKPDLDEIGFQDLITDQMAWWDTQVNHTTGVIAYQSAGKQPAWVNYMTSYNEVHGDFAIQANEMFMVLNRRYQLGLNGSEPTIQDLTTYIDPSKYNNIFAETKIDAQNFWVQIGAKVIARRKMSAKVMPKL